jgi:integral membrane sensor domain MASE1
MHKQRTPHCIDFLLLPLLYYLGAKAGVSLTVMPEGMAILWPPNSVLLTALLAFHGRGFLRFAVLALGAEIAADVPTFRLHEAFLFGLTNIVEATMAWGLLTRWHFNPRFTALHDCVKFVVAGPLMSAFVAACCGALIYSVFRGTETGYVEFLRIWWFGDALGLMILTPLLLSIWSQAGTDTPRPPAFRLADGLVSLAALAVLGLLIASRGGIWHGIHVGPVILLPFVIFVRPGADALGDFLKIFDLCLSTGFTAGVAGSACRQALLGYFQGLTSLSQPQAYCRSIAFDQLVDQMEEIRDTEASQSRLAQLDQRLSSITDEIQDSRAKCLKPGGDPSVPGVVGSILCGLFDQERTAGEVASGVGPTFHEDQHQTL